MASKHLRNRAAASRRRAPATPSASPIPVEPTQPTAPPRAAPPTAEPVWLEEDDPTPEPFDIATFDPTEFEWRPVARRRRSDGWTPEVQVRFIEALAETGLVSAAAEIVDMSVTSCYRLRRAPGGESFARAWRAALVQAAERLVDLAFARAIEGVEEPVFHQGRRVGARTRYDERMAKFIMRAYLPDRFRHAHESVRRPTEAPPAAELPFADALAALMPPVPDNPHLSLEPDRLAGLVDRTRAGRGRRAVPGGHARTLCPPPRRRPRRSVRRRARALRSCRLAQLSRSAAGRRRRLSRPVRALTLA